MSSPAASPASPKSPSAAAAPKSPKASSSSPKVAPATASPKGAKRSADSESSNSASASQSSAKKQKAGASAASDEYALNFNRALDKEHEGKTFSEIIALPPSALQGLSGKADAMLASFRITTIEELAKWKFFRIARAINTLAGVEEKNKRPAGSRANINAALDKAFEKLSLTQIAKEPVSALQGLAEWSDDVLKPLGAGKISQLGSWRFCLWAEAFVELAAYEKADMQS